MSEGWQLVWIVVGVSLLGLIGYSYIVYPWLLGFLAGDRTQLNGPDLKVDSLPSVTVVMSVYNEELVIRQKLESIFASDYPSYLLEVLIGSDCSSDQTEQIIQEYQRRYPDRIRMHRGTSRSGKPAMLNVLRPMVRTSITVLTDANVFFEPDTIKRLVRHFSEPKTGLVGANILNTGMRPDGISRQEEAYIQRENRMKFREGLVWGAMVGPFGGCYALRTDLFGPVPAHFLVDDFYICMRVLEQEYASIFDPEAICYEDVTNEVGIEFRRKRRISAGNFQNLFRFVGLLNPFKGVGIAFWSHKVLRWIAPFLTLAAAGCFGLAWNLGSQAGGVCLVAMLATLLVLPLDSIFSAAGLHIKMLRFGAYFIMMNLALLAGFFRFLGGVKGGAWEPTKRVQA